MKKIFLIITFLFIANICNSQFYIGTIKLKDSSGVLVVNGAIKTNEANATKQAWVKPSNLSSSVAGLGLSLSTTSGLIVNVGDGLQIVNDTLQTDNSQLFNLDTTKLGYLSKPNIWTGNNQWTSSNIFYGITYLGTVETGNLTVSGSILANGNVDISGEFMQNGVPITGGTAVDTSLLMHKNGGTQISTSSVEFNNDVTMGLGTILTGDEIDATFINVLTGAINTNELNATTINNLSGTTTLTDLTVNSDAEFFGNLTYKTLTTSPSLIGAFDINWADGTKFYKTLGENSTFTFSNTTDGKEIQVYLTNASPFYTVSWPTVSWVGGTPPTMTAATKTDIYYFKKRGTTIFGRFEQNMTP